VALIFHHMLQCGEISPEADNRNRFSNAFFGSIAVVVINSF